MADISWGNGAPLTQWQPGSVGASVPSVSSQITSNGAQHIYAATSTGKLYDVSWGNGNPLVQWQVGTF